MKNPDFWKSSIKKSAVLNPVDRISEVLFGLIMMLTFTGAISASSDGRQEISDLLWAALGCNLAWGFVDAVMYLMNVILERGHAIKVISKVNQSKTKKEMNVFLRDEIQPLVSALLSDEELGQLGDRIKHLPKPDPRLLIMGRDILSGFQIFLLVFLCTLPVAIPFAMLEDVALAMRISNGIALLMLLMGGIGLARYAGFRPLLTGMVYVSIGIILVLITIVLGG